MEDFKKLKTSILTILILGIVFYLIGLIIIYLTRLFQKPTKLPNVIETILVGFACFTVFCQFKTNKDDLKRDYTKQIWMQSGYDYEISDNKVNFVRPITQKDLPIFGMFINSDYHHVSLIGEVNGINKTFTIAEQANADSINIYWNQDNNEGVNAMKKPTETTFYFVYKNLLHLLIYVIGFTALVKIQLKAFKEDKND